jgi:hypothetical protein
MGGMMMMMMIMMRIRIKMRMRMRILVRISVSTKGTTQIFVSLADLSFVMVNNSVGVPLAYMGLVRW